jgi:DNA/RNA-binding domain of Phe-tRNA-synthetase-like protein
VHAGGGWHVQVLSQPSGPRQIVPWGHSADDVQLPATGAPPPVGHAPRAAYGRPGHVELAWNVVPSQPQYSTRSRVHGFAATQVHVASQPAGPSHIWPSEQSALDVHVVALAGGGGGCCGGGALPTGAEQAATNQTSRTTAARIPATRPRGHAGHNAGVSRKVHGMLALAIPAHPLLEIGAFVTRLPRPLDELATPDAVLRGLEPGVAPLASSDAVRAAVRALLRHGGFKPAGRSKPASEYLHAAHAEGQFPRVNPVVDACNVVSLCSGFPISVVDLDLLVPPLRVAIAPAGTRYVFNPSGQVIDAGGLLCVVDAEGPTGTPVKDAQRTKTSATTRATLSIVWGTSALPERTARATAWYRELVATIEGATLDDVALVPG